MFVNTSELKARSRIAAPKPGTSPEPTRQPETPPVAFKKTKRTSYKVPFKVSFNRMENLFSGESIANSFSNQYLKAVPLLGISLVLFSILFYFLTNVHPSLVSNWLLYQSYFPVMVIFFSATYFLGKFIFLSHWKGMGLSLWLSLLLFLKFQSFLLSPGLISLTGLILLGIPLILPVLFRK